MIRVYPTILLTQSIMTHIAQYWLWPAALMALVLGTIGVIQVKTYVWLRHLVIVSIGTLIAAVSFNTPGAITRSHYTLFIQPW